MSVLLVSDIHANFVALEAVLRDARGYQRIWCLGDTIGYGPQPRESLLRMRETAEVIISGNHDLACVGRLNLDDFNPDARRANLWNGAQLADEQRSWLAALEPQTRVDAEYRLAHGSPSHPVWEYLFDADQALDNLAWLPERHCFVGHTHVQTAFRVDELRDHAERVAAADHKTIDLHDGGRWFVNPGSVGQPRDRDPRAAYALLDPATGALEFRRVAYDIAQTQRLMRDVGLPLALIQRLSYGV
jgi:predicted phosphodiesterase